jgi:hypothetical protein
LVTKTFVTGGDIRHEGTFVTALVYQWSPVTNVFVTNVTVTNVPVTNVPVTNVFVTNVLAPSVSLTKLLDSQKMFLPSPF